MKRKNVYGDETGEYNDDSNDNDCTGSDVITRGEDCDDSIDGSVDYYSLSK